MHRDVILRWDVSFGFILRIETSSQDQKSIALFTQSLSIFFHGSMFIWMYRNGGFQWFCFLCAEWKTDWDQTMPKGCEVHCFGRWLKATSTFWPENWSIVNRRKQKFRKISSFLYKLGWIHQFIFTLFHFSKWLWFSKQIHSPWGFLLMLDTCCI